MNKTDAYRQALRREPDWDAYLRRESHLPGPRSNLELLQAAADEASLERCQHWLIFGPQAAPADPTDEFLACCGTVGLGRLAAEGGWEHLETLRWLANDPRWRVREAVAMALQRVGAIHMDRLLDEMEAWAGGTLLERRAAAAALAEPPLLTRPPQIERALRILDRITTALLAETNRRQEAFKTLRQGLAYCWSVVVVALPEAGLPLMEKWLQCDDPDVRWLMKENLKKNRMNRMDPAWLARWRGNGVAHD